MTVFNQFYDRHRWQYFNQISVKWQLYGNEMTILWQFHINYMAILRLKYKLNGFKKLQNIKGLKFSVY